MAILLRLEPQFGHEAEGGSERSGHPSVTAISHLVAMIVLRFAGNGWQN
jgi:hypothetical protein